MHIERTAAPPAMHILDAELSPLARTCLDHCPDPDMLEAIGLTFLATAAELRGVIGRPGHA